MLRNTRPAISSLRLFSVLTSLAVGLLTCVPSGFVAEAASQRKIYYYYPSGSPGLDRPGDG